jgi:3-mercaptopyruvate sulfurtransferase SseA
MQGKPPTQQTIARRAGVTASFFRQIGFPSVMAIDGGVSVWSRAERSFEVGDPLEIPVGFESLRNEFPRVSPPELKKLISVGQPYWRVIFVGNSREFADGHIPGAQWMPRSRADLILEKACPDKGALIVITDSDDITATMTAGDLKKQGYVNLLILNGGSKAWVAAGFDVEKGLSGVMVPPEDMIPTIPNRSFENMMNYLSWEENLGHKYAPK